MNVYSVILEIVKQEVIQKPHVMVCSWEKYISSLKQYDHFKSPEAVQKFYRDSEPTNKKVLALLKGEPKNGVERNLFKHLQQYIREMDQVQLLKFLRFATGANIVSCITIISINFIKVEGFQRQLVAHTCGPLLELPNSHMNFCELREQFQQVLSGNSWSFDAI